ncbi:hypothetical protein Ancab_023808 [Ancistrocladus abbreviatus]
MDKVETIFVDMQNSAKTCVEEVKAELSDSNGSAFDLVDKVPVKKEDMAEKISLVLMACAGCYLYSMVPKNEYRCPKCNEEGVLSIHVDNPEEK